MKAIFLVLFTSISVSYGQVETVIIGGAPTEDQLADFCAGVESNLQDCVKHFNRMVNGSDHIAPTQFEVESFWKKHREYLICPDDGLSDEEHFLVKAAKTMNLEFIRLLGGIYHLDLNFTFYDPFEDERGTVIDFLIIKRNDVQNSYDIASSLPDPNDTTVAALAGDVNDIIELIAELKENGALTLAELEAKK